MKSDLLHKRKQVGASIGVSFRMVATSPDMIPLGCDKMFHPHKHVRSEMQAQERPEGGKEGWYLLMLIPNVPKKPP